MNTTFSAIGENRTVDANEFTPEIEPQPTWCPGCGDYAILAQAQKQMPTFGRKREEFVFVCIDNEGEEDIDALNRVHDDDYLKIQWRLN